MKRVLFIFLLFSLLVSTSAFSHPLDITFTTAYYGNSTLQCELTMHPYEASYLLKTNGISGNRFQDFLTNKELFFQYIQDHLIISQSGQRCTFQPIEVAHVDEAEMYSLGVPIRFKFRCHGYMDQLHIKNTLFINDFLLQTNKITFLPQNYETLGQDFDVTEIIFTRRVKEMEYYLRSTEHNLGHGGKDSDGDSLSDRYENLYGTNPYAKDTDGDGFEDWLELSYGFDPNSTEPSPGQKLVAVQMGLVNAYYPEDMEIESLDYDQYMNMNQGEPLKLEGDTTDTADALPLDSDDENEEISESTRYSRNDFFTDEPPIQPEQLNGSGFATASDTTHDTTSTSTSQQLDAYTDAQGDTVIQLQKPKPNQSVDVDTFDFDKARENQADKDPFKAQILEDTLSVLKAQFESGGLVAILLIVLSVFVLGFLHALQAGHGKLLMIGYLVRADRNYWDALRYVTIFSITHLIDIVLLGLVYLFFVGTVIQMDISTIVGFASSGLLLIISVYLLIKGIQYYKKTKISPPDYDTIPTDRHKITDTPVASACMEDEDNWISRRLKRSKKQLSPVLVGFLVGLVPCPFGWGLFLFLVSIDQTGWILPLIGVFGVGIWICLALVGFATIFFKERLYSKVKAFIPLSQIIAASIMIVSAILIGLFYYFKITLSLF